MNDTVIFDSSTLINIFCSGYYSSIFESLKQQLMVSQLVISESNYYYESGKKQSLDLDYFTSQGIFDRAELNAEEYPLFIVFAQQLDDGEAETIAIGINRGWSIAIDDRKAIKLIRERYPDAHVFCTPAIVKNWADNTTQREESVQKVIENIENYARFRPSNRKFYDEYLKCKEQFDWWQKISTRND